ncbi:MAG: protein-methionine-sulfoxide reductase catalytic subunit MsrP [Sphingomonadales bacterium]
MLIKRLKSWEIAERLATPESVYLNRRKLLRGMGGAAGVAALGPLPHIGDALAGADQSSTIANRFPAPRNRAFRLDRPITDESLAGSYNNFYEFGSHKRIAHAAARLKTRPWTITLDGLVEKRLKLDIDDLFARVDFEERLYRHRCVEAWSMAVPWTGFPFRALLDIARPLGSANYVEMTTFHRPRQAPGQKQFWYPWPYTEGLTMAEAANELAFLVTGVYGKPLANQFGAPLRLAAPWKYGFKSIKSIVRFRFKKRRPRSFWEEVAGREYGFWANVNPNVPHPRWSQATEEVLGAGVRVPTRLFNGYGEFVAGLYKGLENEKLFM